MAHAHTTFPDGLYMKKAAKRLGGTSKGHVLGERTFAAITAVEGIGLSAASRKRLATMKKLKLTNDERRSQVVRAYSEAKTRKWRS